MIEPSLAGLLLAAGGSERLGQAKQMLTLGGETLVRRSANLLLEQAANVVVVTGADAANVSDELRDLPIRLVHNGEWRAGLGGSIAAGVDALSDEFEGVLILLCDQWRIGQSDLDALCEAWKNETTLVAAASWGERYGSPSIFPRHMFSDLSQLRGDSGARGLIRRQPSVRFVDIPHARYDLDTPADAETMRRLGGQSEVPE